MDTKIDRAPTAPVELEQVRTAIMRKGAKWFAAETAISRLAPEVREALLSPVPFGPVVPAAPLPWPIPPVTAFYA